MPDLPLTGGCPCGAVRYEVTAPPLFLYACHCTQCQRASGASFALNMPVRADSFRIAAGTPKVWPKADSASWFCGDCGGRIYGERASRPRSLNLRAGTLDDTSWLRPGAHIFMGNAQPWETVTVGDCFMELPEDFAQLVRAWRA